MSLKERLKNNPWLTNKKYPILYFVAAAALLAFFISTWIEADGEILADNLLAGLIMSIPFTAMAYFIYVAGNMLSVNFVIKNHRHTPLLLNVIFLTIALMIYLVHAIPADDSEKISAYQFVIPFLMWVIYLVGRMLNGAKVTLFSLGILSLLMGFAALMIVSYFLGYRGTDRFFILGTGGVLAVIILVIDFISRKKYAPPKASLALLEKRFELYLHKVFKGLPSVDELLVLREQLASSLSHYAEQNFSPDIDEYKQYANAIDSLGDYSALLYPYRKNIFARLAISTNRVVNITICLIMQIALTIFYTSSMHSGNWSESIPVVVFGVGICIKVLTILRIVQNFRKKTHSITAVLIGIVAIIPTIIVFLLLSLEDVISDDSILPFIVLGLIAIVTAAVQLPIIAALLIKKHRKRRTVKSIPEKAGD